MPAKTPAQRHSPVGDGLCAVRLRVADDDIVYFRAILEAYDHLGFLYGEGDGTIYVATTNDQAQTLHDFLDGLSQELVMLAEARPR